jgi:hypothetical protein
VKIHTQGGRGEREGKGRREGGGRKERAIRLAAGAPGKHSFTFLTSKRFTRCDGTVVLP